MFKTAIVNLVISLLSQIPWAEVVQVIRDQFERKVQPVVLREIDRLVDQVDEMDLKGKQKFQWVSEALRSEDSLVKQYVRETATHLLDTAIQIAVTKLRAVKPKPVKQ